jgi:hypothetical protein
MIIIFQLHDRTNLPSSVDAEKDCNEDERLVDFSGFVGASGEFHKFRLLVACVMFHS